MSADTGGGDVHAGALGDVKAAAAARAAATASAFAAAANGISPLKRSWKAGDTSETSTAAEVKKLRDDETSNATDTPEVEEDPMDDTSGPPNEGTEAEDQDGVPNGSQYQWHRMSTAVERAQFQATRKAERAVRRIHRGSGPSSAGFEVDFIPTDENVRFTAENLLRVFCDIREVVRDSHPRLNARGGVTVKVPQQSQIEQLKSVTRIAGVEVKLNLPSVASLWGRVSGVHPLFSEEDLREALKSQGVVEVMREKYSTCESTSASENKRVQKPSNRIRIRFEGELKPEISIAHQVFKVTLCPASPLQCLSCCGFGHRAALCPEKSSPRCRNCGAGGHQLWQCTAKPKCINCKGSHSASDSRCPVYAVYAKAAQDRFVGKVVAGLDNVSVKESVHLVEGAAPAPAVNTDGTKASFAAVVGSSPMVALVRETEEGDRVVCYLPKPPVKKRLVASKPLPKAPERQTGKPGTPLDTDALIASITAKVIEKVSASLDSMIAGIVSAAIAQAVPNIALAVAAALKAPGLTGILPAPETPLTQPLL